MKATDGCVPPDTTPEPPMPHPDAPPSAPTVATIPSECAAYRVNAWIEGESGEFEFAFDAYGVTEAERDAAAHTQARQEVEEWVRDGEWGDDGASVYAWYTLHEVGPDGTDVAWWDERRITVDIDPDDEALIIAATDPGSPCRTCTHEWTHAGHGGCEETPGVWSTGGTSFCDESHCVHCGLVRTRRWVGSQRNPGEHDTIEYVAGTGDDSDA